MEQITRAVEVARYNEAVIVNVENEEGNAQEVVLVATLDQVNGGVAWQNAGGSDPEIGIVRHLRTKRWVLPMLNDTVRNQMYHEAIQKACKAMAEKVLAKKGSSVRVLDIGSGTGLLAMMASKYARECLKEHDMPVKVVSLEMAGAMARLASLTVAANKMNSSIEIKEQHSSETTLSERAMLCTSELLESGLLGEGIIPALRDAWERHLHPEAIIVPQKARVYAQLLESKERIMPYAGPKGGAPSPLSFSTSNEGDSIIGNVPGVLVPIHAEFLLSDPTTTRVLTEKTMVMDFDFTSQSAIPGQEGRSRSRSIIANASGTVHGVLFWWELDLWDGATYSTECGKQNWQDHWQQCLYVFTSDYVRIEHNKEITLTCHHTDTSLSFSIGNHDTPQPKRPKTASPIQHITPFRARLLADDERVAKMQKAISSRLKQVGLGTLVLDLSDFSLCAVLAALAGGKKILSVESCSGELPLVAARVAQIGNNLPQDGAEFSVLQCHSESLSLSVLGGTPAKMIVSEPYYQILEGWHLQEAINFFFLLKSLKHRGLAVDYVSVPCRASVMVCAIESDPIFAAYGNCGDENHSVCGLDHSLVSKFGARYNEYDMSIPSWQYPITALSSSSESIELDYNSSTITGNGEWKQCTFTRSGTCHAVKVSVVYDLDDENTIDTSLQPFNQVVRLFKTPIGVKEGAKLRCRLTIGGSDQVDNEIHKLDLEIVD